LYLNRSLNYQQERFTVTSYGYDGTVDQYQLKEHSPLIDGNMSITVGGVALNGGTVGYSTTADQMQGMFRRINGLGEVEVVQRS
jgi:hypothetical protein